jgi:hypothetical protein
VPVSNVPEVVPRNERQPLESSRALGRCVMHLQAAGSGRDPLHLRLRPARADCMQRNFRSSVGKLYLAGSPRRTKVVNQTAGAIY